MSKKITLISLALHNFKGIKDIKIDFTHVTNIYGENGTGKTTISDASSWLFFDKDSHDRKDFEIKTLAPDGQTLHGLDHEVIGILSINGKLLTLQKTYREIWTKKRGEADKKLTGNETLYYIDDVPVKKSEYQDKINSLIGEDIFKVITNPLYFSAGMKWQDRRSVLLNIIGDITPDKIINYKPSLRTLDELLQDKDIDTLKRSIAARRKKLNDDIKEIPIRIDTLNDSIKEVDFEFLERQATEIKSAIQNLEEQMFDSSKVNDEVLKDRQRLYDLKSKLQKLEYESKQEAMKPANDAEKNLQQEKMKLSKLESQILFTQGQITTKKDSIAQYETQKDELRKKWTDISQETFDFPENETICPKCMRPLEYQDIETKREEMLQKFNADKAKKLENIQKQGFALRDKTDALEKEIEALETSLKAYKESTEWVKNTISEIEKFIDDYNKNADIVKVTPEMKDVEAEIKALENKLQEPAVVSNNLELKALKNRRMIELESVNKQLAYKEQNATFRKRIAELQEQEKALGQQIAVLEGQEYLCEEFIKAKVELLESSINSKFKYVNFKLFKTHVNEGIEECCEALINGVPFSNANTASQINAGLDIINALCEQYGVSAPVFIDNRESVNQIIECDSQVINLIVSQDKTLRVEGI